jgi:hypothetical protein
MADVSRSLACIPTVVDPHLFSIVFKTPIAMSLLGVRDASFIPGKKQLVAHRQDNRAHK